MYDSIEQVNRYLVNTVVLYDQQPYWVNRAIGNDRDPSITLLELPGYRRELSCSVSDPLLNYQSFQLGYVNLDNGSVVYCRRMPKRQQQQGLSGRNIWTGGIDFDVLTRSRGFARSLVNDYPTIAKATKLLEDGHRSVAISRHIAIAKDEHNNEFVFMYRGRTVGVGISPNKINPLFEIQLKETFSEYVEVA